MPVPTLKQRAYSLFALLILALVVAGSALLHEQKSTAPPVQLQGRVIGSDGAGLYGPAPGGGMQEEANNLEEMARYWHERVTYPTGRFDPKWLDQAEAQDRLIQRAVPAGNVIYNRAASHSPLALDPTRFTSLGPSPLDWFVGQTSGRVNAIAADPTAPNVVYLGVAGGGVWKSTNCCSPDTSWLPTTDVTDINGIGIGDVTVDPNNHNVVYAGTGDLNFTLPEYSSGGILKSTNAGATWTVLGATTFAPPFPGPPAPIPEDQAVGKVRVDPRNSNNVVAGTKTGLFFSYDGGVNWAGPCYTNPYTATQRQDVTGLLLRDTGSVTEMFVAQGTRGYTFTVQPNFGENGANGIYKATIPASGCPSGWTLVSRADNGWPAGTGSGIPVYQPGGNVLGRIDLAFAPSTTAPGSSNVTVYAQVQSTQNVSGQLKGGQLGLWRSTDGGDTWTKRSDRTALSNGRCPNDPYGDFPQNWFDQGLAVDPLDANRVYMDTYDLWRSTDGGTTFNDVTCGYTSEIKAHPDHHAILFLPSPSGNPAAASNNLIAGTDGGVYSTTDAGTSWDDLNHTLSTLEFYSGDISGNFANSSVPAAVGGMQDNGSAAVQWGGAPGPINWQAVVGGDGIWSRIEPVLGQTAYLEQNGGHLYASTQGVLGPYSEITGAWRPTQRSGILPYEIYKNDCPSTGCTHLIIATNSVSETITGLGNWVQVSPNFPGYVDQLSYSVSLSTTALIGTNLGMVAYGFGLGHGVMANWVDVSGGNAVLPNRPILDVTTDPINPLVGYAAIGGFNQNSPSTPGHVFQVTCSTNCASFTWLNKTGNLPDLPIDSILANPRYPQQVFAGSDWGLYYTNDITANPPTWYRFETGLPHTMIWDMQIDGGFTTLSLWTRSRGAYAWPLPSGPFPPGTETPSPTPLASATTSTAVQPSATRTSVAATSTRTVTATATVACQVYGYSLSAGTMISGTTDIGNHCEDCATTITLPFPVSLYDQTFTTAQAGSNGFLSFGDVWTHFDNTCLPNGRTTYTMSPFWVDQMTNGAGSGCATCGIYTTTVGTAPNRTFIVEYRTVYFNQTNASPTLDYEIQLQEGQPTFKYVYGLITPYNADSALTIGVQKSAPSNVYTQYYCDPSGEVAPVAAGQQLTWAYTLCATATVSPSSTALATSTATSLATGTPLATDTAIPTSTACPIQFTDVPPDNTFYPFVRCLACRGILGGYDDGTFRPGVEVTRGQIAKIVSNAAGFEEDPGPQLYEDVDSTNSFYQWINRLSNRGFMGGYPCGNLPEEPCNPPDNRPYFRPFANATRAQLAKIVSNAAGFADTPPDQIFADVPPDNGFYLWIERLASRGIMGGYPCGGAGEPCDDQQRPYFRPYSNVTRGQTAKIVSGAFFPNCQTP